jgi:hypothetical protein
VGPGPIRHALKINPWARKYLHYSAEVPGYRWPARRADDYASQKGEYDPESLGRTSNPALVMGTLLAIPPQVELESLGLATEPGRKLFTVLQDYGAYIAEDAGEDTWDWVVERDAEREFEAAYGFSLTSETWKHEIDVLVPVLQIVDNNGPDSIGGGGQPRAPLAPPFE